MRARGKAVVLMLAAATPCTVAARPGSDTPGAVRHAEVRFGRDLALDDIRLTRPSESRIVVFRCPAGWKAVAGSRLHLFVAHSPHLDGERSFMTVTLNGHLLRSVRLDDPSAAPSEIVMAVGPEALLPRNELRLSVTQSPAREGAPLWTRVEARSFLTVAHEEGEAKADALGDLPLPLYDPDIPRARRLAVLMPERLTVVTLEATALLVAHLALRSAPQPLVVTASGGLEDGVDPLVAVGTPAEQPALREVSGGRLVLDASGRIASTSDGRGVGSDAGVVGLARAGSGGRPVLYATGNTPEAVLGAAWSVIAGSAGDEGGLAVVVEAPPRRSRGEREWKGFIPPRQQFRLAEVGHESTAIEGATPARLRLPALPDTRFLRYGHSITLALKPLPPALARPGARLEVSWNDVVLCVLTPREIPPRPPYAVTLSVPAEALGAENVLSVEWRDPRGGTASEPLVLLDPEESHLRLPRDSEARLPDLALLRSWLYPFSLHADLSNVILVVPDRISQEIFLLACEAAAGLGRILPSDRAAFRVRALSELTRDERSSSHLVLLRPRFGPDPLDPFLPDSSRAPDRPAPVEAVLQEAESPWGRGLYLLSLRAGSARLLLRAFRALTQPEAVERLAGDTAFLSRGGVVSVTLGSPRLVRRTDYLAHLEAWLRAHWLGVPLVVTVVSGLLFGAFRLALAGRRAAGRPVAADR